MLNKLFPDAHVKVPMMQECLVWMTTKPNIEIKVKAKFNADYEVRLVKCLLDLLDEYKKQA